MSNFRNFTGFKLTFKFVNFSNFRRPIKFCMFHLNKWQKMLECQPNENFCILLDVINKNTLDISPL